MFQTALIALLFSLSHCTLMCGGFCLLLRKNSLVSLLAYHAARIGGYLILGTLFYFFGKAVLLSGASRGLFFFIVGVFVAVLGVALFVRGELLAFFERGKFVYRLMQKARKNLALLGLLNGFLPCGVVYFFVAKSTLATSLTEALLTMLIFGISTTPAFVLIFLLNLRLNAKFTKTANIISCALITLNGIYLAFLGFKAFGG